MITPSIATATTLRAPIGETLNFVHYYLNLGVDKIYLFFDDPSDPAVDFVDIFPHVTSVRCDIDHWNGKDPRQMPIEERQHFNGLIALEMARKEGCQWLIHVDIDELIYLKKPIKNFFSEINPGADVVNFPTLEAVPHRLTFDHVFSEIEYFKTAPPQSYGNKLDRIRLHIKHKLYEKSCKAAGTILGSSLFKNGYLKGHSIGKSASRTSARILKIGNHYPTGLDGQPMTTVIARKAWVLHFDACGFDSWYVKWERRYNKVGTAVAMSPMRKKQGKKFQQLYDQDDIAELQALYKNLYFLSTKQIRVLKTLGLVKRIRLRKASFDPPLNRPETARLNDHPEKNGVRLQK